MKLLHITFHKGCELDIEYAFTTLGHELHTMYFDDGETTGGELYKITHDRAQKCWDKYQDYFHTFDGMITSDTCPTSRPFLQNNWSKLLIIWVCNRFDYAMQHEEQDREFYELLRDIPNRKNVFIFGYTSIENVYSTHVRRVNLGDFVIKPIGKNVLSKHIYQTYENDDNIFYVPTYHNETNLMNLSEKLTHLGIQNRCERFKHISELIQYKGGIYIPYAWSTLVFFERIQLGLVTFIPSLRFLMDLFKMGNWWFQPPFSPQNPELLKLSEWYCDEHRDILVYFDSWEDLQEKVKTTDYKARTETILKFAQKHHDDMLSRWNIIINRYNQNKEIIY
jgi:hypothetical protein